ncbi:MAG: STAS domain-containing protein [Acidobacteria bacterium]|nr:STAS domain-containing protein [Acidobacteriota bacterium]
MKVNVRNVNDVRVVDFEGRLALGDNELVLSQTVDELLAEGCRKILLNLTQIEYIDSSGLGELVQSFKVAKSLDADLKLLRPQERVRHTLQLSMLLPLFEIYDTEEEALASFNSNGADSAHS